MRQQTAASFSLYSKHKVREMKRARESKKETDPRECSPKRIISGLERITCGFSSSLLFLLLVREGERKGCKDGDAFSLAAVYLVFFLFLASSLISGGDFYICFSAGVFLLFVLRSSGGMKVKEDDSFFVPKKGKTILKTTQNERSFFYRLPN
jgi:hypothetical protein